MLHQHEEISAIINTLINLILHADNSALDFNNRDHILNGCETTCKVISKWGLTTHVGQEGKKSKAEAIFFH